MAALRIASVEYPLDDPRVFDLLTRVLARADSMGLVKHPESLSRLDEKTVKALLRDLGTSGIATRPLARLRFAESSDPGSWIGVLTTVDQLLEESPAPQSEWPALTKLLGQELLTDLVAVSASSARRYAGGERSTPDDVADRLHFLALLVADLTGAYNEIGIRRWFDRPRSSLHGLSPKTVLERDWVPGHEGPRRVRELARALTGSPAT